jgi:hypothetical protein
VDITFGNHNEVYIKNAVYIKFYVNVFCRLHQLISLRAVEFRGLNLLAENDRRADDKYMTSQLRAHFTEGEIYASNGLVYEMLGLCKLNVFKRGSLRLS